MIWQCNPSRIRNIKIERKLFYFYFIETWPASKQLYHNNTLPFFSPLPKLGHGCAVSWPRICSLLWNHVKQYAEIPLIQLFKSTEVESNGTWHGPLIQLDRRSDSVCCCCKYVYWQLCTSLIWCGAYFSSEFNCCILKYVLHVSHISKTWLPVICKPFNTEINPDFHFVKQVNNKVNTTTNR